MSPKATSDSEHTWFGLTKHTDAGVFTNRTLSIMRYMPSRSTGTTGGGATFCIRRKHAMNVRPSTLTACSWTAEAKDLGNKNWTIKSWNLNLKLKALKPKPKAQGQQGTFADSFPETCPPWFHVHPWTGRIHEAQSSRVSYLKIGLWGSMLAFLFLGTLMREESFQLFQPRFEGFGLSCS